jgi:hypothetical protein
MQWPKRSKEKYKNNKVTVDGIAFDSKREANRYCELKMLEKAGRITDLDLQKVFVLIPAQFEESGEVYKRGKNAGQPKRGKCLEQSVTYKADFYYKENGREVVEDVKGYRDPASGSYARYTIKRKLMLYIHGIRIKEI